jgi:hypothetical protein
MRARGLITVALLVGGGVTLAEKIWPGEVLGHLDAPELYLLALIAFVLVGRSNAKVRQLLGHLL